MPLYQYKAENAKGQLSSDAITAASREDAAQILKEKGYKILAIKAVTIKPALFAGLSSVPIVEKATLCRYLSTMMKAALPLPRALEIIITDTKNRLLKKILEDVQYGLRKGQSVSAGLSRFPHIFDPIFITLVKAGEESGTLEQTFEYLGQQLMSSYELNQKVKGALTYPAVVLTAMVSVGVAMLTFVLPKIGEVFLSLNLKIPAATKLLLTFSKWMGDHSGLVVLASILSVVGVVLAFKYKPTRQMITAILGRLPVISRLLQQLDLARFCRTLSVLLKSSVPIVEALNISSEAFSYKKYRRFAQTFESQIKEGKSFSIILEAQRKIFPSIMIQTIKAGEESGSLEMVLLDLAGFYEREIENTLKRLVSLLEPILMLIIGAAVGAMVISIIAPIYSVVGNLQGQMGGGL
ncbi:type II secretion system F family protein [Patescibacteria group bacterium]|nr:type II secretion system F family protein [Patescibacteria group bacterium]MBU1931429.1 type II secretion system F family protein [Patescibacteria group bacterium]